MQKNRFFKKRSPPPLKYILIMTTITFVCIIFLSIWLIDRGIRPTLMDIANENTTEFATRIINGSVQFTEKVSFDDLVDMLMDKEGNVTALGWNSDAVNEALRTGTERAEYFLYSMNKGVEIDIDDPDLNLVEFDDLVEDLASKDPTVVEIPIGQATGNTVLRSEDRRVGKE